MNKQRPYIVLYSILILYVYLIPILVQDIHSIFGHQSHHIEGPPNSGRQVHSFIERCNICVFEFNIIEKIENHILQTFEQGSKIGFPENYQNQIQNRGFHYYNLRAPPKILQF